MFFFTNKNLNYQKAPQKCCCGESSYFLGIFFIFLRNKNSCGGGFIGGVKFILKVILIQKKFKMRKLSGGSPFCNSSNN